MAVNMINGMEIWVCVSFSSIGLSKSFAEPLCLGRLCFVASIEIRLRVIHRAGYWYFTKNLKNYGKEIKT